MRHSIFTLLPVFATACPRHSRTRYTIQAMLDRLDMQEAWISTFVWFAVVALLVLLLLLVYYRRTRDDVFEDLFVPVRFPDLRAKWRNWRMRHRR